MVKAHEPHLPMYLCCFQLASGRVQAQHYQLCVHLGLGRGAKSRSTIAPQGLLQLVMERMPPRNHSEILLLALQFAGKLNVPKSTPIRELAEACSGWVALDPQAELEWYEEIKFEPEVMCEALDGKTSCVQCQLEDGDILIYQTSVPKVQSRLACRPQGKPKPCSSATTTGIMAPYSISKRSYQAPRHERSFLEHI